MSQQAVVIRLSPPSDFSVRTTSAHLPSFHWQCHHWQQRRQGREKWSTSPQASGTPSAGCLSRGPPKALGKEAIEQTDMDSRPVPELLPGGCGREQPAGRAMPGWALPEPGRARPLTSSAVQKEASAFLYICQMSWYWIGKMTKRRGLSRSSGSSSSAPRGT